MPYPEPKFGVGEIVQAHQFDQWHTGKITDYMWDYDNSHGYIYYVSTLNDWFKEIDLVHIGKDENK